jgi:di/tricarboxylate transporter
VIERMFLTTEERQAPVVQVDELRHGPWTWQERRVVAIVAAILGLWFTTPLHGFGIATTAIIGAIALTAPAIGVMPFKAAIKAVNWSLVVFVGSAMVLGQALIDTQAANWLVERGFDAAGLRPGGAAAGSEWIALLAISIIAMASHLVMTSHVARAAALAPPFLILAQTAGLQPMAVLFIASAGMNYCLTFPVCSKALLLFQESSGTTFDPRDLARLSLILAPLNLVLMVVVYFAWWRWTGLALTG